MAPDGLFLARRDQRGGLCRLERWQPVRAVCQHRRQAVGYTTGYVNSSPAVANGVVYFGSNDVYALDASTGALLWSYAMGGWVSSSPAVANGVVYAVGFLGNLYALNATTGALLWSDVTAAEESSPAVANGVVSVGGGDGVYALNASTGAKLWSYANVGGQSSPAVANGVVYVGSDDNNVYALNALTG
jgi:eukaryotic-like serine/threonine-protein kinase